MSRKNGYERSANQFRFDVPFDSREEKGRNVPIVAKVFRATGAVVFFGIPLVVGAGTLLGYLVHKAYKQITKRS